MDTYIISFAIFVLMFTGSFIMFYKYKFINIWNYNHYLNNEMQIVEVDDIY